MEEEKIIDLYNKWLEFASEDYEMAGIALANGKLLYCAFHLQQSLEKIFKGLYILYIKEQPPYIHDLVKLLDSIKSNDPFLSEDKFMRVASDLNPFYIIARYPAYKNNISKSLKDDQVQRFLSIVGEIKLWCEQKKKS
jgi:HEPN domain-containing protein